MTRPHKFMPQRILELIAAKPGIRAVEIQQRIKGSPKRIAWMLTNMVKDGSIFRAGTPHRLHYYPTAELAEQAAPQLAAHYQAESRRARLASMERYDRKRRKGLTHAQRAAVKAALEKAKRQQVKPKTPGKGTRYRALDAEILRMAEAADGFRIAGITIGDMAFNDKTVGNRVAKLCAGQIPLLFRAKVSHRVVHFFRSQAAADKWLLQSNRLAMPAPVTLRLRTAEDAEIVIPPHVVVQRIPHRPGRFEVDVPKGRGQISQDWYLVRQGVDLRAALEA